MFAANSSLCFHPIARFPGPSLWTVSRLPYVQELAKGRLAERTFEIYHHYGPIVLLALDEISFIEG